MDTDVDQSILATTPYFMKNKEYCGVFLSLKVIKGQGPTKFRGDQSLKFRATSYSQTNLNPTMLY